MLSRTSKLSSIKEIFPKEELHTLFRTIFFSLLTFTLFSTVAFITFSQFTQENKLEEEVLGSSTSNSSVSVTYPVVLKAIPTSTPTPTSKSKKDNSTENRPQAKVTQIDEVTYSVDIAPDTTTAGTQEIFTALNNYRASKGASTLTWDPGLASYAQSRADLFAERSSTDKHEGFNNFLNNNGFSELGFNSLGENSSYGYHVSAKKLIEEVYAADAPHDNNQLDNKWTHVGVGVNGTATDLIFGGNKQ